MWGHFCTKIFNFGCFNNLQIILNRVKSNKILVISKNFKQYKRELKNYKICKSGKICTLGMGS